MEIVVIFRQLTTEERGAVLDAMGRGSQVLLMPGLLADIDVPRIPENLIREARTDLINTIKAFGDKDSGSGRTISEVLTLDGVPLWHYQRFRVFFQLKDNWVIDHCIEYFRSTSEHIWLSSGDDFRSTGKGLTVYVPAGYHTTGERGEGTRIIRDTKPAPHKQKVNYGALFNYVVFFKLRILLSMIRRVRLEDKQHVVVDRSLRQVCRNISTLEQKQDNFNLYPLFDANPAHQLIISEVETPKIRSAVPFRLFSHFFNGEGRKERTVYGEWILFRGLLPGAVRKHHKALKLQLKDVCRDLQSHQLLIRKQLSEKQLSQEKQLLQVHLQQYLSLHKETLILRTFCSLRKSSEFYLLKQLCYHRFFSRNNFRTICAIDENSPATRSILDAARKSRMTTIGIQHGNIGDSQPAYLYTKKDKERKVMTDLTLTWGDYFTEFLLNQANYPAESVKTVGQMRSDLIPVMKKASAEFRKRITTAPFLAVFASQPIRDKHYRHKVAFDVFSTFRDMPEAKLLVKLHPGERYDVDYYRSIAEEAGYKDPDIRYEIDLYELLSAADVVITCFSTVGSEAVYFGKPLIIYDPFREDLLKYVAEGVAFEATDLESLSMLVHQIKAGQLMVNNENYSRFIRKYAYAIDGNATQRTIDKIVNN